MKVSVALAPVLLCFLGSCYTRQTEPREAFTLRGHVAECGTGSPIEGAIILVTASEESSMGFFGSSSAEGGSAITDANGDFALIPYEYSFTESFRVQASKAGYNKDEATTYKGDILSSGATSYQVDSLCLRH